MLKGLEISEVRFSDTVNPFVNNRIDAEYFNKNARSVEKKLLSTGSKKIEEISTKIVNFGAYSLCSSIQYTNCGVPYLFVGDIKENYIDLSKVKYIDEFLSKGLLQKSLVTDGQLLLTIAGTIGNCAVANNLPKDTNSNQAIANITLIKGISPYYVSTFINSKFGKIQTKRHIISNVQPNLLLNQVKQILIAIPSILFSSKIEFIVKNALSKRRMSEKVYLEAEALLLNTLGLSNVTNQPEIFNIKSLGKSFGKTSRLDAEYYQKKYEDVAAHITTNPYSKLAQLVKIQKSIEPGSDAYNDNAEGLPFLRVADYNKFGITQPQKNLNNSYVAENYKKLHSLKPKKQTILFSKDGSVGQAYCLRADADFITSGAILHLTVKNPAQLLPDYLTLVLNSKLVQMQAERDVGGSIILHWRTREIEEVLIPLTNMKTQEKIADLVKESFALKTESQRLLDAAKRAVEIAIEENEQSATTFLQSKVNSLDLAFSTE